MSQETPKAMSQEIEASRETDERIAVEVMGWTVNRADGRHWHTVGSPPESRRQIGADCCAGQHYDARAFMPSRHRESALEVVDRLTEAGLMVLMKVWADYVEVEVHSVGAHGRTLYYSDDGPADASLPKAICRAALSPAVLDYLKSRAPLGGA